MKKIILFYLNIFIICFLGTNVMAKSYFPEDLCVVPYSSYLGGYGSLVETKSILDINGCEAGGTHFYKMPYLLDIPVRGNNDNIVTYSKSNSFYYFDAGSSRNVASSYTVSNTKTILYQFTHTSSDKLTSLFKIPFDNGVIGEIGGESEVSTSYTYGYEESRYFGYTQSSSDSFYISETGYYQPQLRIRVSVYVVSDYITYGADKYMPSRKDVGNYYLMLVYSSSSLGVFKYIDNGDHYTYDGPKVSNVVYMD